MRFHDEGSGPAVVLLHGWPVTALHWRSTTPALLAAGLRVVTVTLPGLGESDAPGNDRAHRSHDDRAERPYDKQSLSRDVAQLVTELDLGTFAVVGHDWGGTVGYLLAADLRGKVSTLIVEEEIPPGVEATVPEPGHSTYPAWHGPFLRAPGLAEALVPGREDDFHRLFLLQSAGPAGLDPLATAAYLAAYRRRGALAPTLGYYRTAVDDAAAVRRRAAVELDLPVLTIGGEFGMGTAVRDAFTGLASHVEHLQVPGAGHYPAEQSPDTVLPALLTHLTDHHLRHAPPDERR